MMQPVLTLFVFLYVKVCDLCVRRFLDLKDYVRRMTTSSGPSEVRELRISRHLEPILAAAVELQKAQIVFTVSFMIAVLLYITSSIDLDTQSMETVRSFYDSISRVPQSACVAIATNIVTLRSVNRLSWNLLIPSLVAMTLSVVVTCLLRGRGASLNSFTPTGAHCGLARPAALCQPFADSIIDDEEPIYTVAITLALAVVLCVDLWFGSKDQAPGV